MKNIRETFSFSARFFIPIIAICLFIMPLTPVLAKEFRGGWSNNSAGNVPDNDDVKNDTLPALDGLMVAVEYLSQGMPKLQSSNPLTRNLYARNISILVSYARIKEAIQYAEKNWKWDNSKKQNQTLFKDLNNLLQLDAQFKANVFAAHKAYSQGDPNNTLQYIGNALQAVNKIFALTLYSDAMYDTDLDTAIKAYTNMGKYLMDSRQKLEKFLVEN